MTSIRTKSLAAIITSGLVLLAVPSNAFAATISLSPSASTITVNQPFTVDVILNEQTDRFNAAQANVTLSSNLTVSDMVLGNCNFSFIKTPSTQNPSFVGVTLGDSKNNCRVYTLTILPTGSSNGTISITDGSVKRNGDAAELLTAVRNGEYTVNSGNIANALTSVFTNAVQETPFTPVTANAATIEVEEDLESYTVAVKVVDAQNLPLKDAVVTLKPQLQATSTTVQQVKTNSQGVAEFKAVDRNVYTVKASHNDKIVAEHIINTKGSSQVLTLGLQQEKEEPNYFFLISALVGLMVTVGYFLRSHIPYFNKRTI
jgi:hypothetical protein